MPDDPTWVVEASFGTDPLATPSWTDISSAVQHIDANYGRDDELGEFQPGSLTVTLDNNDRAFDPFNPDGTHFGDLLPGVRVRVKAITESGGFDAGFDEGFD